MKQVRTGEAQERLEANREKIAQLQKSLAEAQGEIQLNLEADQDGAMEQAERIISGKHNSGNAVLQQRVGILRAAIRQMEDEQRDLISQAEREGPREFY